MTRFTEDMMKDNSFNSWKADLFEKLTPNIPVLLVFNDWFPFLSLEKLLG